MQRAAFFFTAPAWELATLAHLSRVLEEQLPAMLRKYDVSPEARSRSAGVTPDIQAAILYSRARGAARAPLLISVWSTVESCYVDISAFFAERLSLPYSLRSNAKEVPPALEKRWHKLTVLERAKYFYPEQLSLDPFRDVAEFRRLNRFRLLRNALAHAGGRKHAMQPSRWKALIDAYEGVAPVDSSGESVELSAEFVRDSIHSAIDSVTAFCARARHTLVANGLDR